MTSGTLSSPERSDREVNPYSQRVIDLVVDEDKTYKAPDTGLFFRQTHAKDGTQIFVAYNPHEGHDNPAECFVFVTPQGNSRESEQRLKWHALEGPAAEEAGRVGEVLDMFEKLIEESADG